MHGMSKKSFLKSASRLLAGVVSIGFAASLHAQAPELIFHNGKILTVDSSFSTAQAVAVTGNKISAVGANDAVLATAGPSTQKIDLKGRTMIPGLVDTHRHMYGAAESTYGGMIPIEDHHRFLIDWRGVKTKDDVLAQIKGLMEKHKFAPGRWVYFTNNVQFTGGGGESGNEGGNQRQSVLTPLEHAKILYDQLNQWELDKVTPNNPVLLSLGIPDFNGFLLNKVAMDWVMTNHADFVKKNGRFWIDQAGRPDGHLEPPASRLVLPFTYDRNPAQLAIMYEKNMYENLAMGMTAIATRMPNDSKAAYKLLESQGKLHWRIGVGVIEAFGNGKPLTPAVMKEYAAQIGTGTDKVWITGVGPTAVDGVTSRACTDQKRTGTYTAIDSWFPVGQCHMDAEYRGSPKRSSAISENYYRNWVMASGRDGVRFANVHVAGDRGTGLLLNAVEQIQQQYGPNATKDWAFDHCDMVNPRDFPRLAKLKITVSCYVLRSVNNSGNIETAYGTQVANTFPSPLASMVKAGARVVLESDSNSYLWDDLRAAVTRKDRNGKVWAPQEKVDRPTALRMLTNWAAEYVLKGDKIGTIEKGKYADMVVLDKDYLTMPEDDIATIAPQVTVMDGKIVYVHKHFATEYNLRPAGAVVSSYEDMVKSRQPRANVGGMGG